MADCAVTSSEAEDRFRAALAREPFDAGALHGLGHALLARGRKAEATALLSAAASASDDPAIHCELAAALHACGFHAQAEARAREVLAGNPAFVPALRLLAAILAAARKLDDAEQLLRQADRLTPHDPDVQAALVHAVIERGNDAYAAGNMAMAETSYRDSIALAPASGVAHMNLANALLRQMRVAEALAAYRQAVAEEPANDAAAFSLALCLLLLGEYDEGLRLYERRRAVDFLSSNFSRRPELPQWRPGDSVAGKRVLVLAEQGAGDLIQYARFVPALARLASGVVLEMPWPMAQLFHDLPGIERIVTLETTETGCDIACPLLSLPLMLGVEAGVAPPYATVLPERQARWEAWLERSGPGRRIGLVCSGDPRHARDRERSFPLSLFKPLLRLRGLTFVVVQSDLRPADRDFLDDADNLRCPAAALTDYADTAGLLANLDLLVSADTSVAHLAGAMGIPVWTLLPFCPDYRWLLGREDSPWYPSMRLFRQDRPDAWEPVIKRVRQALLAEPSA